MVKIKYILILVFLKYFLSLLLQMKLMFSCMWHTFTGCYVKNTQKVYCSLWSNISFFSLDERLSHSTLTLTVCYV